MASVAWWERVDSHVREWLIDNNGDSIPAGIARHIVAAGGDAVVGQPLPDEVVDWIEAVANGESPPTEPREPRGVDRYRITLEQLEQGVHIPADKLVTSKPADRPPAEAYEDEAQRQLRLAGGV